jgi:hypothetical protein
MIGRVPRHTSLGDDVDPGGLFVFIPGALATGFLISIGLLVGDAFRGLRGDVGSERRVRHTGAAVADEVRGGSGAARRTVSGLRSRPVYGVVGAVSLALVVAVIPGATWNFLNPVGYIGDIGWIWAVSLLAVLGLAVLGTQTLRLVPEWVPFVIAAVGVGFAVRFALGGESVILRSALVVSGLVAATVGVVATWRLRRRRDRIDVPPSVRPILTRTPLTRPR